MEVDKVPMPAWFPAWAASEGGVYMERLKHTAYYRALARQRAREASPLIVYTYGANDEQWYKMNGWSTDSLPVQVWEGDPSSAPSALAPPDQARAWTPSRWAGGLAPALLGGAALLALLVLAARLLERCRGGVALRKMQRRSREWPTPNVCATRLQMLEEGAMMADMPPPSYYECAGVASLLPRYKPDADVDDQEPPPPYSDTYVEFSNTDGIPTVIIITSKRTPLVNRRDILGSNALADAKAAEAEKSAEDLKYCICAKSDAAEDAGDIPDASEPEAATDADEDDTTSDEKVVPV